MKELNHCSECDEKLSAIEKKHNKDCGIEIEEWLCNNCEMEYA